MDAMRAGMQRVTEGIFSSGGKGTRGQVGKGRIDEVDQLNGWPVGRRETPLVDTLTSGPVDMGDAD